MKSFRGREKLDGWVGLRFIGISFHDNCFEVAVILFCLVRK